MKTKKIYQANINTVSWNDNTMTLEFSNGQVADYLEVPEGIYEGVITAESAGSYMNRYIKGNYSYIVTKQANDKSKIEDLEHYKTLTAGMWATDRPDLIPENIKHLFVQLEYKETNI